MTFNKDLQRDSHHFTRLTKTNRQKIMPISAQHLSNGTRYAATIVIKDYSLLKNIFKEVIYPEVEQNKLHRIEKAFFTSGSPEGSTIITLNGRSGSICFQFFLVPKDVDYKQMEIFLQPFQTIQPNFELEEETSLQYYLIPHLYLMSNMMNPV